jgi:hypothetical protein
MLKRHFACDAFHGCVLVHGWAGLVGLSTVVVEAKWSYVTHFCHAHHKDPVVPACEIVEGANYVPGGSMFGSRLDVAKSGEF